MVMEKVKPQYLYHYTSIESLAMILSTKKIRFNSLNFVDDLQEKENVDFEHIANYILVSCWTDLEEESIPFWNMYTPNMRGVRIKLPYNIFKEYYVDTTGIPSLNPNGLLSALLPKQEVFHNDYWILNPTNYLTKVNYTNSSDLLNPKLESIKNDSYTISIGTIGRYKSENWKFQSEWRFILYAFPTTLNAKKLDAPLDNFREIIKNGEKLPFNSYDVNIQESAFEKMEILLGPKHSLSDKIIVESLLEKFNHNATLKVSSLYGAIKK